MSQKRPGPRCVKVESIEKRALNHFKATRKDAESSPRPLQLEQQIILVICKSRNSAQAPGRAAR